MIALFDVSSLRAQARPKANWDFGAELGHVLTELPPSVRESAAATCRFQIMGWNKGNHDGSAPRNEGEPLPFVGSGRWVYTRMQSYGHCPNRFNRCGPRSTWTESNSFEGADEILSAFGLTMKQVLDFYGDVPADGRLQFDLVQIISDMLPDLAVNTRSKVG